MNEVAVKDSVDPAEVYCSYKTPDFISRVRLAAAISTTESVSDHLEETINLTHFIIQKIEMDDEDTKEKVWVRRTILLDDKGIGYSCISSVIVQRLWTLVGILGKPDEWPEPVKIAITEQKAARGKFFDLTVLTP